MKKSIAAVVCLSAFSLPAAAGPNWDVIHKAETDQEGRNRPAALVLPLDHGPRAITTPWLNHVRLGEMISQLETKSRLARHDSKKVNAMVAAPGRPSATIHS